MYIACRWADIQLRLCRVSDDTDEWFYIYADGAYMLSHMMQKPWIKPRGGTLAPDRRHYNHDVRMLLTTSLGNCDFM